VGLKGNFLQYFAMLKAATSTAGELVAMCGQLTSYHGGKLGVIEE
jgi:hypothetical protein